MQFPLSNYLDFLELPCFRDAFELQHIMCRRSAT